MFEVTNVLNIYATPLAIPLISYLKCPFSEDIKDVEDIIL